MILTEGYVISVSPEPFTPSEALFRRTPAAAPAGAAVSLSADSRLHAAAPHVAYLRTAPPRDIFEDGRGRRG